MKVRRTQKWKNYPIGNIMTELRRTNRCCKGSIVHRKSTQHKDKENKVDDHVATKVPSTSSFTSTTLT
jgi:hypothetical protein